MQVITTKKELSAWVAHSKSLNHTIGFVPTMGALHQGHLSLLQIANSNCDVTVCSIFVNPTQFTNPSDLDRYPRPIEKDKASLEASNCTVLFMPTVTEMYAEKENWHIDLAGLDTLLEGEFRPGHFQGVTQIVKKLIDLVQPDGMYMGQKDFQQVLVLKKMIEVLQLPVKLIACPIIREPEGLAMSSRNVHLSTKERQQALLLSHALYQAKTLFAELSLTEIRSRITQHLQQSEIALEYFDLCNANTLQPAQSKNEPIIALVAARVGNTRLIDNEWMTEEPLSNIY